jgi:single-strand DNA-binding protein
MASFNKVILLGNVTRDPELRYISSGTPVTEIGLAVNNRRKCTNGEWVDETTFVDVTFWSRDAEIAGEYVTKGSPIMIEGRLKLDTWEKDGKKNSKLRVVGERLVLLGSRQGGPEGGRGGAEGAPRPKRAAERPEVVDGPEFSHAEYDGPGRDGGGRGSDSVSSGGSDDDIPF